MRLGRCAVAILFCLCLLSSSATSETAVGFSFFRSTELSLWRVKPRSMIGVGFDLNWYRSIDFVGRKSNTTILLPSLTVIQIHRSDELAPLSYQKAFATIRRTRAREWYVGGEIGIGFIWRPPKKNISLSVQQGISLQYGEMTNKKPELEEGSYQTDNDWWGNRWSARGSPARVLVTFSF